METYSLVADKETLGFILGTATLGAVLGISIYKLGESAVHKIVDKKNSRLKGA